MAKAKTKTRGKANTPLQPSGSEATKSALMTSALKLFAAKGYRATTVQDIASAAGANVSLVSYHFQGKEGLLRACLESTGNQRLEVAQTLLAPPQSAEEFRIRLSMYTDEMLKFHVENPDVCTILHRDLATEMELIKDIFETTFLRGFHKLIEFMVAAKERHLIHPWVDPLLMASNFFGTLLHNTNHVDLAETYFGISIRDPAHRERVRDQLVRSTIEGCCVTHNASIPQDKGENRAAHRSQI